MPAHYPAVLLLILFAFQAESTPPLSDSLVAATVGREGTRIKFLVDGDHSVIDITSPRGIDQATIRRRSADWPRSIRVRLRLTGLEHFSVTNDKLSLDWAVSSGGEHTSTTFLRRGREASRLAPQHPLHTTARIVGGNGTIPLRAGYFEVPLPNKLFEENPEQVKLKWIDFYR